MSRTRFVLKHKVCRYGNTNFIVAQILKGGDK